MTGALKKAARVVLHSMGGLAVVRGQHRREFGVPMFHSFKEADRPNIDALCAHIARYYEPVSLSTVVSAIEQRNPLPDNAITVTIDDGYRSFLRHGHPIFRKHRIPTTLYAVVGFADGRLWLWPDQIEFGLRHTPRTSLRTHLNGTSREFALSTPAERTDAIFRLSEELKEMPNEQRLAFLAEFGSLCGVEIPSGAPPEHAAMTWDELRAVAAEGVEIGCHTDSHPILSRLANAHELEREVSGARQQMEERLKMPVRHFCYPNGRAMDIGEAAIRCARDAGYASAVTCTWGLNTIATEPLEIRRTPFESAVDFRYGVELLAGLHL